MLPDPLLQDGQNARSGASLRARTVSPIPGVKRAGKAVTRDGNTRNGNTAGFHPVKSCLIEVEFISNETALNSVKLPGAKGVSIKDTFSESAADDIYNNILEQE